VVTELLDGWDCSINLAELPRAMGINSLECWLSEYQEQMVFICTPSNYSQLETLANRYGVQLYTLGVILHSKQGKIYFNIRDSRGLFDYTYGYNDINQTHQPEYYSNTLQNITEQNDIEHMDIKLFRDYHSCTGYDCREPLLERSLKFHLTNKIDRCVGGCVVQQSCIGAFDIPIANYSITRATPLSQNGILSAIGENIFIGQSISKWIDKTICELLSNLAGVPNLVLNEIKLSGNWMLNAKSPECLHILYKGVNYLSKRLIELSLAIDGGKDSLSMSMDTHLGTITSPPTLVLTSYSLILEPDIEKRVSPILSSLNVNRDIQNANTLCLFYIDILAVFSNSISEFLTEWNWLQKQVDCCIVKALHDGSQVIDILEEMAITSGIGLEIIKSNLPRNSSNCIYEHHYIVIQLATLQPNKITISNNWHQIATTINDQSISYKETRDFIPLETIFNDRCKMSLQLDTCAFPYKLPYKPLKYKWPSKPFDLNSVINQVEFDILVKKIVIIQDEGSNSHREMASAFLQFPNVVCYDITLNELISNDSNIANRVRKVVLESNGIVLECGFAYGDILGSGKATAIIMKTRLGSLFDTIFNDPARFVLGVCNGCQILVEYGLFGHKVSMKPNQSGKR
jgi:phosphoribosylformylglycinamidine synthase